ncbi:cytoplasmic dynein 1 light intermediate chain 2 isoform X1 [Octopus sinensis]|uniref:Dynein light intermediate chain n=1 Tax=Octopus sinensis TaxID=2607531 RepID=A0A6P7S8A4_9MOLL|nr:cytoplasmic dynein 1 light intermediate chain 2 isoform X1 [Octopus sinensis]
MQVNMAPIGDRRGETDPLAGLEAGESQNLWATILSEVQSSSASKLSNIKSVLVIGDTESGKTTLIAKLQGNEDPKKGAGLEYYHIDVKDEYRDDQTRLGAWILDGDTQHINLLKYALTEENFAHTLVLLVVSMAQPWNIMDSLQKWITILRQHIEKLKIPKDTRHKYEQSLVRFFQEYSEPEEGGETISQPPSRRDINPLHPPPAGPSEENVLLPLPESTLNCNLGIPIVVLVTKTDTISVLEKEHDYKEEHFDFIQQHLRKFCLNYGAALIYTSVKEEKNCDLLFKYLVHRIYGFSFSMPAYVVEKDSVFVPAGWDTEKKISILNENLANMKAEDLSEDIPSKPVVRKPIQKDAEIVAEDEQVFLMRQQSLLNSQPAPGSTPETPIRSSAGVAKGSPSSRSSPGGTGSPTSGSARKVPLDSKTAGTEGMLANFFNSLLSKKTEAGNKSVDKAAVTRDAAAELDRLNRTKKTVTADGSPRGSNEPGTPT